MKALRLRPFVRVLFVICALVAVAGAGLIRRGQGAPFKLPPGNWTLSAVPHSSARNRSLPVRVFSVTMNAARGLSIGSISVFNRSSKDIRYLKVHWSVKEQSQEQTLLEGDTELSEVMLPAGSRLAIDHPIVSFAKIYQPLMRNGVLEGNYTIDIAVNEVKFVDGTKWTIAESGSIKFAHAPLAPCYGCTNTSCRWNPVDHTYYCGPNEGTNCRLQGEECTTEACSIIE